jgi:hypothetical protein
VYSIIYSSDLSVAVYIAVSKLCDAVNWCLKIHVYLYLQVPTPLVPTLCIICTKTVYVVRTMVYTSGGGSTENAVIQCLHGSFVGVGPYVYNITL